MTGIIDRPASDNNAQLSSAPTAGEAEDIAQQDQQEKILQMISALGQQTRLEVFRLLVREGEAGMVAGQIARTVGAPHNTLSTHLAILHRAGLIAATRQGRNITYKVVPDCLKDVIGFLLGHCCQSLQPDCLPDDLLAQLRVASNKDCT